MGHGVLNPPPPPPQWGLNNMWTEKQNLTPKSESRGCRYTISDSREDPGDEVGGNNVT